MMRNPHKNPNPQGKGLVPVLRDWQATRALSVAPKGPSELLWDWFVSTLVLSADFRLRPVVGRHYFLYRRGGSWLMSLVAPDEWGDRSPGSCLGECSLRPDMTWEFEVWDGAMDSSEIREALTRHLEGFTANLQSNEELSELLPAYRRELPYYQRMLATGLGASLRQSARQASILDGPADALLAIAGDALPQRLAGGSDITEADAR